jgi:hypothetical protein
MPRAAAVTKAKNKIPPTMVSTEAKKPVLVVDVDWGNLPVLEAQALYAKLRMAFERAGSILNARTTRTDGRWLCFMGDKKRRDAKGNLTLPSDCPNAGLVLSHLPKSTDNAHVNATTGLLEPVHCCSELCHIRYQALLIDERREKYAPKRGE